MPSISTPPLPEDALLRRYENGVGHYTDCFVVTVPETVELSHFIDAFYTAPLFRTERVILKYAAKSPSTDKDAADIACGRTEAFAAWTVEARTGNQLLMCDMASKTRSWFMVDQIRDGTCLYFGSAVTADKKTGRLGFLFNALLPLHKLYARALLKGAVNRLSQGLAQAAAR
ncbi:hypothetical protein BDE40_1192 [Litoreibacter halocynthiae]|uniref:Polyketide cyclase/dehydrase/lipid transport protein n=1 Tax=Litoreibacter halocynthiae TaxID=1242689 RepID=A0A4R7LTN3_9RHOB|nr:hypothetical protein [Litoreibacter halocynthiae]TDT77891.1 hypothetical protein BDE40_1192 [Litoreibacter halocynthiae]